MCVVCDIIIQIEMRNLLSTPLLRYNYLKSFKKPVVEMPSTTPPKYIYQVEYHPSALPDFDMKFRDHDHVNDWKMIAYQDEQKFDFQYSGQWWETISIAGRLSYLLFLVGTLYLFISQTNYRKQKKFPGMASYYNATDLPIVHFPTIIQH